MAKFLIDTSIIASSLEDFKRRYVESKECTLVLSNLTFSELEDRKVDHHCNMESKKFVRFLIDLFVRDKSTEVCKVQYVTTSKHIDYNLVDYAKCNNLSILTCDKGMALYCRFENVPCELLEIRKASTLPFVIQEENSIYLNLYNGSIPKGFRVFAYLGNNPLQPSDSGLLFLNSHSTLLVAHPENGTCGIDTYYISNDMVLNLISKNIYSSEEDIDNEANPFHKELFQKWINCQK